MDRISLEHKNKESWMIPPEAYDLPGIGCLPSSFSKFNFIVVMIGMHRLWDGLQVRAWWFSLVVHLT